jgi:hypothetical protein
VVGIVGLGQSERDEPLVAVFARAWALATRETRKRSLIKGDPSLFNDPLADIASLAGLQCSNCFIAGVDI